MRPIDHTKLILELSSRIERPTTSQIEELARQAEVDLTTLGDRGIDLSLIPPAERANYLLSLLDNYR